MLVPVSYQKRFPIGRFHQILQSVQLSVMDGDDFPVTVIHSAVRHLQKFIGKSACADRIQFFLSDLHDHIPAEILIDASLFPAHLHFHTVINTFRHIQIVHGLHGNADIRDQ